MSKPKRKFKAGEMFIRESSAWLERAEEGERLEQKRSEEQNRDRSSEGRGEKRRKYLLNVFHVSDATLYKWPSPPAIQEAGINPKP